MDELDEWSRLSKGAMWMTIISVWLALAAGFCLYPHIGYWTAPASWIYVILTLPTYYLWCRYRLGI